ncbi:hypothetical protein BYT27DRAFT_7219114 [Phlegmacium glaucopus]|nr:hypothetical protein BYT27DRAFT_7219114 [Phlegmacium glaucopus]
MCGPVQTKWAEIYCWVSAQDGMGSLPENILGLGSGPNGWPGPDKIACQKIFWGLGLDQMGGPVQTKWVAIYCWVSAWDGMGGLPENILGMGSGPKWVEIYFWVLAQDRMGSLSENIQGIRSGIGSGPNGWSRQNRNRMEWVACQTIFWGSGLDQMGGPVQTKWVAIYCWVSAWDGMGGLPENSLGGLDQNSLPENILGLGSGPNGWPGPDKMGSHILLGIGLGWNGWPARK